MNDWIVTTAFYSALHLVQGDIFPLPVQKRVFNDFESYYNSECPDGYPTQHNVTKELVADHLPELSSQYTWLYKECRTARYRNYKIRPEIAQKAREYLAIIEERTEGI